MKSLVIIPVEPGTKKDERRQLQRRMSVPRRLQSNRRRSLSKPPEEQRKPERRGPGERRRLPERRLGLKLHVDLSDYE